MAGCGEWLSTSIFLAAPCRVLLLHGHPARQDRGAGARRARVHRWGARGAPRRVSARIAPQRSQAAGVGMAGPHRGAREAHRAIGPLDGGELEQALDDHRALLEALVGEVRDVAHRGRSVDARQHEALERRERQGSHVHPGYESRNSGLVTHRETRRRTLSRGLSISEDLTRRREFSAAAPHIGCPLPSHWRESLPGVVRGHDAAALPHPPRSRP